MIGLKPHIENHDFLDILDAITSSETVKELYHACESRVSYKCGIYHHVPTLGSFDHKSLNRFWSRHISDDVLRYLEKNRSKPDPAMQYVFTKGRPFWLSALLEQADYNDKLQRKLIELTISNVGDGLVFPVFGPYEKRGYIYLGFEKPREFYTDLFPWQIQSLLQAVHVRYCTLLENLTMRIKLTNRENEVLELLTLGKTNPEIGIILGISTSTVSGHVKRIFLKFDARDRVTVALRARSSVFGDLGVRQMPKYIQGNTV